ncbi:isochorismate synthase [Ancylobacter sp. A5.8]|uniref:isochorismate synthase n=1 Tax=Ancylobacter gelatini TaxID=2919920 RepID=UPI001F4ED8C8|nr:isochorismate synthase [Ancylobacter gelatini]MCJ8145133.1 isochorismate synthase [Ancylobacter gelatini]
MRDAGTQARFAPALPFALVSDRETVVGRGCLGVLPAGERPLGERVGDWFAAHPSARLLVGALPYDHRRPAHLFQPAEVSRSASRACFAAAFPPPALVPAAPAAAPRWTAQPEPSLARYRTAVAEALAMMARGEDGLRKIVLSRSLRLNSDRPVDASALLRRLAEDHHAVAFCVPLPGERPRALVGATPELLIDKKGAAIVSHPLAGSARRSREKVADEAAARALLASEKDNREHQEVVSAILDQLAPYCTELGAPEGTQLTATNSMWHLGTRITGRVRDAAMPSVDIAALLHPTPAVCGTPRAAADRAIAALEGYDRGFYAGAVGWCDASGDGTWHVAIRCAEIADAEARLYAGAGIVPGSDPQAEGDETSAKFAALLRALGIDEDGHPLPEDAA